MCAELRNPADALQILARSGEARQDKPLSPLSAGISPVHDAVDARLSRRKPQAQSNQLAPNTKLEHYELVQRGLLGLDLVADLLEMFAMHSNYCRIIAIAKNFLDFREYIIHIVRLFQARYC